jgi:sec-independent protein translocase protein TatC
VTPRFLVRNSRYAILAIFILAAVLTPSPDVVNMSLLAGPMCALFALGVFASYLYTLHRDERAFPWRIAVLVTGGVGAAGYVAYRRLSSK